MKKYRVKLTTKDISLEWWGQQWCSNVSNYADYSNRLERGRAYIRKGAVGEIQIVRGTITAEVKGTHPEPYNVVIKIDPVSEGIAEKVLLQMKDIDALARGYVPECYRDLFSVDHGVFPSSSEIHFSCSCPDVAYMCKHVAAVLFAIGSILDYEPLLLFEIRGIDVDRQLDSHLHAITNQLLLDINSFDSDERLISDDMISDLFGIDIMTDIAADNDTPDENNNGVKTIEIGSRKKDKTNITVKKEKVRVKKNPIEGKLLRQFSKEGQFVAEYTSYEMASNATSIGVLNIQRACRGEKKSAGGFLWQLDETGTPIHNITPIVSVVSDGLPRPVLCYDDNGVLICRYGSLAEAVRTTGINSKSIREAAIGKQKHAGGYVWKYEQ